MSERLNRSLFLLAQLDRKIELVMIGDDLLPKIGEMFDRMPALEEESWTVIKIFKEEEHDRMVALITLIGLDNVKELFALELPEVKTYEQAFAENVSRMGGEA